MILTGDEIKRELGSGNIIIDPFRKESVQPNSYDFHLGEKLMVYKEDEVDSKGVSEEVVEEIIIPKNGYMLRKGQLYLGITEEYTATEKYSQLLFGDRSIGSLGIWAQVTAPLAHVGHRIRWTLELRCIKDVIVYPGMKFGKICFLVNQGTVTNYGDGKFQDSGRYLRNDICPSLIERDNLHMNFMML